MGKKLEGVRKKSQEGNESFKKGGELGKKAVKDVKSMKKLIDSLPTDVDDEIVTATKAVEKGTKSDAEHYMKSDVKSSLDTGKKSMRESTKASNDQIKNNEKVTNLFKQMDAIGSFGKGSRTEGNSKIENSTKEFNKTIKDNEKKTQAADTAFKKNLSDISDTF